ncbi:Response regulator consisting of a CheY-like receiver domain and a winged-helix DNA-binding domain [Hahella chejuensis KCTC 2396]|uniref:Response regulator consisting of a CheY-like receiver domain and a winged-helix DNA-binding domain n=1 Tax=Hahella chejuensis (strain KCTC 2396) TaxID=349521 RepID=Q2S740_HAHCH|nr:response regulator transcription factor [Hahella chejuensis]ABC33534.1 Response regulator consisting of a CheY-like receiver domain and a winged-helix DNA-binding domain [Hahella chejuensis KCTC 2396]
MTERLLLVDDDKGLTRLIKQFLEQNGYPVKVIHDGESAVSWLERNQPQLIILDVMLPGMDGLSVCREVRKHYKGPIIMLTSLDDDIDEVAGLEVGADDYLAKPVKSRVLLAHIRAQLRRVETYSANDSDAPATQENGVIRIGELVINSNARTVVKAGVAIDFTTAEFNLLYYLARQAGSVISRDLVYREIFNLEYDGLDRSIDLRVSRIRKRLGDDPKQPRLIKTIRGEGYLFVDNADNGET